MLAKTASCVAAKVKELVEEISKCPHMTALRMEGNTVGVEAAEAIAKALEKHPEFEVSLTWSWVCCYCSADTLEGETEVYFCQTLKNSHYTIHCFTFKLRVSCLYLLTHLAPDQPLPFCYEIPCGGK